MAFRRRVVRERDLMILRCLPVLVLLTLLLPLPVFAQSEPSPIPAGELAAPPTGVGVRPQARDEEIRNRLGDILNATGWYHDVSVETREGVVFLEGRADTDAHRAWAAELARRTQDVVAVVNRMSVAEAVSWDFSPALAQVHALWMGLQRGLPSLLFAALVLLLALGAAWLSARLTRRLLRHRLRVELMRDVVAYGVGSAVFLVGLFVVLHVAGLVRLALTVMGGTGLLGLVIGIAFRDITENFLASIFLSVQRPFNTGDRVRIVDQTGYVQALTVRTTVLTQAVALRVLADHPAVLRDPEPWVLVDALGSATVNLRVYFWLDGSRNSQFKVRSSVIRLVKAAFQEHGISMPDESREILFPREVPVRLISEAPRQPAHRAQPSPTAEEVSTPAEAGLDSEAAPLHEQARRSRPPELGHNLLS